MRQTVHPGSERTAVIHDPHPLWIEAVESVLASIDVTVVGRAATPEQALELVDEHRPTLLITETQMPNGGMSGPMLIRTACERFAALRVIVLGSSHDPADIDEAFDAGTIAYVLKTAHPADVAATIRQTFDHSVFLANVHGNGNGNANGLVPDAERELADHADVGLTRREREILALVSEGYSNRELAKMIWVTEQTVKFHLSNIYRKLDVSNRTEASRWAHKHRMVDAAGVNA
jgi:two-component system, NarL family, response regulator DegU